MRERDIYILKVVVLAMDIFKVRQDFPALSNWTYLDSSFVGLIPNQVKEGYDTFVDLWLYFNASGEKTILTEWLEKVSSVRGRVAELIGVKRGEIAFTTCTGSGLNIVVNGMDWEDGDNVVFPEWEHNPLDTYTLRKSRVKPRAVPIQNGEVKIEDLEVAIDDRTRLVQVSQVSYINGFRFDLGEVAKLAHDHGARLLVDATQAVGALKVDYRKDNVDYVSFAPYKYLMGPAGLAMLYVKEELIPDLTPDRVGWKNQIWEGEHAEEPLDLSTAEKYEYGTINFQGVYALERSLDYLNRVGLENVEERVLMLSKYLWTRLNEIGKELYTPQGMKSPIISFFQENAVDLAKKLMREKVKVTGRGAHGSHIRASVHFYNTKEDIDQLIDKI